MNVASGLGMILAVFASPLGLLALLAVPAVVVLHLYRRRFRPHQVSALFLWVPRDRSSVSGRKRQPLQKSASFWLELFAALAAGLAFAGPRACSDTTSQHLVCVLDGSASMAAASGDVDVRRKAIETIRERIESLPANSRVSLILSGSVPSILAGPSAFPEEALAALDEFAPSAPSHSLMPSIALGERLANQGAVWLVTDRVAKEEQPANVAIDAVGVPCENLAIVAASRIPSADPAKSETHDRVFATVQSFASSSVASRLELSVDGEPLTGKDFQLDSGERTHLAFEIPRRAGMVRASLPSDGLEIDNVATLAPNPPRTLALYSNLPSGLEARLGFAASSKAGGIDQLLELIPSSTQAPNAHTAHLLFNPSLNSPAGSGSTWAFVFAADSSGERQDLVGPFLAERRHDLLRGVTLDGIIWSRNPEVEVPGSPLVSAGNYPLLSEQVLPTRRLILANLDPDRSSLQRSPDWPILLSNLAELRRRELPGARSTSLSSGQEFVWLDKNEATYEVEGPNYSRELQSLGTLVIDEDLAPGEYVLRSEGQELCRFGVTFADAVESDLRDLSTATIEVDGQLDEIDSGSPWLQLALYGLVLLFILGDWWVLARGAAALSPESVS